MEKPSLPPSKEEVWDNSHEHWLQLGNILSAVAKGAHNIDVDELTLTRWQQMSSLMREIDTRADDSDESRESILEKLKDFSIFADRYPNLAPDALGEDQHRFLVEQTEKIFTIGDKISNAKTDIRYIGLRRYEAQQTVRLFTSVVSEETKEVDTFDDLCLTFNRLGTVANIIDSLEDLERDHKEGKVRFEPSPKTYVRLAQTAFRVGLPEASSVINTPVLKEATLGIGSLIQRHRTQGRQ